MDTWVILLVIGALLLSPVFNLVLGVCFVTYPSCFKLFAPFIALLLRTIAQIHPYLFTLYCRYFMRWLLVLCTGDVDVTVADGCPAGGKAKWIKLRSAPGSNKPSRRTHFSRGRQTTGRHEYVIVWMHGGGFVAKVETGLAFASAVLPRLGSGSQTPPRVLSVSYDLPGRVGTTSEFIDRVVLWLQEEGVTRIILAGDSAGGYLATNGMLSKVRKAQQQDPPHLQLVSICGAILFCPLLDCTFSHDSVKRNARLDLLNVRWGKQCANSFVKGNPNAPWNPDDEFIAASPLHADTKLFAGLTAGSMLSLTGKRELLHDEAVAFKAKAEAAGAEENAVELLEIEGTPGIHDFIFCPANRNHPAWNRITAFIQERFEETPRAWTSVTPTSLSRSLRGSLTRSLGGSFVTAAAHTTIDNFDSGDVWVVGDVWDHGVPGTGDTRYRAHSVLH